MNLDDALAAELEALAARSLRRELPPPAGSEGRVDFCSNDVLDLARHEELAAAAAAAASEHGAGGRAARLLGGGDPGIDRLEREVAAWLHDETALLFPTGYHANLAVVTALAGPGDVILSDALNHASIVDGCRLSRARTIVHAHADVDAVDAALARAAGARRRFVVTESVFSMDGDLAPLDALDEVCRRRDAWLIVDEAHAVGLLGPEGAGGFAATGRDAASSRLAARVVTGGKALGVAGALVVGRRPVIDTLVQRARPFVFTTAPPPAVAAALLAAVRIVRTDEARGRRVRTLAARLAGALDAPPPAAAIVPAVIGDEDATLAAAARCREAGFDVRAVRPPTVPRGTSRLRLVVRASHSDSDVDRLARVVREVRPTAAARAKAARSVAPATVVVGTDTGVGKTVVSALLLRRRLRAGPARYWKPVQTGDESDTDEVRRLAGAPEAAFTAPEYSFPLPASPHEAAAAAGAAIDVAAIDARLDALLGAAGGPLIVEPAGGLMVPFTLDVTLADWLAARRLPVVLVARSGLGTLNHTFLTLEALRARSLEPRALFLVGPEHRSNRETLAARGGVAAVHEVPPFSPLEAAALDAWLDRNDLGEELP